MNLLFILLIIVSVILAIIIFFAVLRQHYHWKNLSIGDITSFRIGDEIHIGKVIHITGDNRVVIAYPPYTSNKKWICDITDTFPI
jgi:preprotein translocase subunit YajC